MVYRNPTLFPLLFAFVVVLFAPPATAADTGPRGQLPFSAYAKDGNGTISRTEFNATRQARQQQRADEGRMMRHAADAPSFKTMDSNKDGRISRQEFNTARQQHHEERREMRQQRKVTVEPLGEGQRSMPIDPLGKGKQMPPDPLEKNSQQQMPVDPYGQQQ